MKITVIVLMYLFFMLSPLAICKEDHDHSTADATGKKELTAEEDKNDHDHDNEKSHDHDEPADEKEHDHEHEEKNPQVGENKGILIADKDQGFKLSPEAERNFEIKRIKIAHSSQVEITKDMIVTAGVEENIYRFRDGFYKRIDFAIIKRIQNKAASEKIIIRSKDLKDGDEIVTAGLGFLRVTEIAAYGGAPEGHSH